MGGWRSQDKIACVRLRQREGSFDRQPDVAEQAAALGWDKHKFILIHWLCDSEQDTYLISVSSSVKFQ